MRNSNSFDTSTCVGEIEHDIGYKKDPDNHEQVSSEMFLADKEIQKFLEPDEVQIVAEAIVDSRVIPGMTLEIITEEMGLSYKILNSSTIIVGPGFMGELLFDMYKCVIVGNKVKLVENIMLNN